MMNLFKKLFIIVLVLIIFGVLVQANPALNTPTVNVKGQSGTLAVSTGPSSCTIPVGGNSCQIPLTWTTISPRTDTTTWFVGGTPAPPGNSGNYINTAVSGAGNISVGDTSGT